MSKRAAANLLVALSIVEMAWGFLPPERVAFRPDAVLPAEYVTVFEGFATSSMGAGSEFEDGYWLVAAPETMTGDEAVLELKNAMAATGFDAEPAGPLAEEWTFQLSSDDSRVFIAEFKLGETRIDTFAPAEQLLAAARDHADGPLVYIHATAAAPRG